MTLHVSFLGHHRPEQIELCLEHNMPFLDEMGDRVEWWFVWQHYPLPNKRENTKKAHEIARNYGLHLIDHGRGLGMLGGVQAVIAEAKPTEKDKILFLDPDERIVCRGAIQALDDVTNDPDCPMASLCSPGAWSELARRPQHEETIAGHHCVVPHVACQVPLFMARWGWLSQVGGYQSTPGKDYGGTELALWPHLLATNTKWPYLADYWTLPYEPGFAAIDEAYQEWKISHAHAGDPRSFEQYLLDSGVIFD